MLKLVLPPREYTIETPEGDLEFRTTPEATLLLEHSLISISKWEAKYKKPFLSSLEQKTREESLYYVKCMTLNKTISDDIYSMLTDEEIVKINEYIEDPRSATWFSDDAGSKRRNRDIITSELIYYWMVALQIPVEFEKWHLNRLITLIKICEIKQRDPKKMKKNEILARNRKLNEARRKRSGSKG